MALCQLGGEDCKGRKGVADRQASVKEHGGIGTKVRADSSKEIKTGAGSSLFSVRQEVCWLSEWLKAGLIGGLEIGFWFAQQFFLFCHQRSSPQ